jgi:hypothetical protein
MRYLLKFSGSIILFSMTVICSLGQGVDEYPCISRLGKIGTQERQEDRQAKIFIRKEYTKQNYNRFAGTITIIDDETYNYDDEVLKVFDTCKDLKKIFQKGIIYPEIFTGPVKMGLERGKELELMIIRNDSLRISNLEELTFLKNTAKTKTFRFWLYAKGIINPTVYFIELSNETANRKTDLTTFINGSKLTFFKSGWLIL